LSRRSGTSRRGGRRNNSNQKRERRSSVADKVQLTCAKCGKPIRHPQMAMAEPSTGEPLHFDCVIQSIAESENLGAREKICYLGQGTFGIIKFKSGSSSRDFVIKKRIPFENRDTVVEWRSHMRDNLETGR